MSAIIASGINVILVTVVTNETIPVRTAVIVANAVDAITLLLGVKQPPLLLKMAPMPLLSLMDSLWVVPLLLHLTQPALPSIILNQSLKTDTSYNMRKGLLLLLTRTLQLSPALLKGMIVKSRGTPPPTSFSRYCPVENFLPTVPQLWGRSSL